MLKTREREGVGERDNEAERDTREGRRRFGEGKREWKRKPHRVMCVGVVLHVYKPAAYRALLFHPKK